MQAIKSVITNGTIRATDILAETCRSRCTRLAGSVPGTQRREPPSRTRRLACRTALWQARLFGDTHSITETPTLDADSRALETLRRLAVGGMGELHLARRAGELVVVKRLKPDADDVHRHLFRREGEALGLVDSPYVTRLIARHDDALVLEYVDGVDLRTLLESRRKRGRPVPTAVAQAVLAATARGVAALHDVGVIHRDLNPNNILLSRNGDVKVADLGVAGRVSHNATSVAGIKGTLGSMAPEQLAGSETDPRTDLYALGLVAYELLTGVLPGASSQASVAELVAARQTLPAPPSTLRPALDGAVDNWVLAALAPSPEDRPQSIEAWLGTSPLELSESARTQLAALVDSLAPPRPGAVTARPTTHVAPAIDPQPASTDGAPAAPARLLVMALAAVVIIGAVVAIVALQGQRQDVIPRPTNAEALQGAPLPREAPALERPASAPTATPGVQTGQVLAASLARGLVLARTKTASVTQESGDLPTPPTPPTPTTTPTTTPTASLADRPARQVRPPRRPVAVAARARGLALRVKSTGGAVHVRGPASRGLAPFVSGPVSRSAQLLTLTGGDPPFSTRLRVSRDGDTLRATLAAGTGAFHDIRCGGRSPSAVVRRASLARPLRCAISEQAGGRINIVLDQVPAEP